MRGMNQCPRCGATERQSKNGFTEAGSQRYKFMQYGKKYTSALKQAGYAAGMREQAVRMYVDGMNLRRSARHMGECEQLGECRCGSIAGSACA